MTTGFSSACLLKCSVSPLLKEASIFDSANGSNLLINDGKVYSTSLKLY